MNEVYFVIRSEEPGHEMYFSRGPNGLGTSWTFKISKALWWKTDRVPKMIAEGYTSGSTEGSVIKITKAEYFKRVLQGK